MFSIPFLHHPLSCFSLFFAFFFLFSPFLSLLLSLFLDLVLLSHIPTFYTLHFLSFSTFLISLVLHLYTLKISSLSLHLILLILSFPLCLSSPHSPPFSLPLNLLHSPFLLLPSILSYPQSILFSLPLTLLHSLFPSLSSILSSLTLLYSLFPSLSSILFSNHSSPFSLPLTLHLSRLPPPPLSMCRQGEMLHNLEALCRVSLGFSTFPAGLHTVPQGFIYKKG